jgi:hypothetical protein
MDFKEKITTASSFGILVAACYLFGYWGAFNINILELGSLADLAKLASFPLLTSLLFLLAGTFATDILQGHRLPSGGGNSTPIGQFGLKHWRVIVAMQVSCIALVATFGPEPGKWFLVAFLVALLSTPLSHADVIIEFIPDPKLRNKVLYFALLLPPASFGYGRLDAHLVKEGHPTRVVDVARSKLELKETTAKRVAYLGRAGEIDVLYELLTGTIVLVKQPDDNPLFIIPRYETTLKGEAEEKAKAASSQTATSATAMPSNPSSTKKP